MNQPTTNIPTGSDEEHANAKLFSITETRAAALLATNLIFIAEFQFNMSNSLHWGALMLLSLSTPLLATVVLVAVWWRAGIRPRRPRANIHFGPPTNWGSLATAIAIGLCIASYDLLAGALYSLSCCYFFYVIHSLYAQNHADGNIDD